MTTEPLSLLDSIAHVLREYSRTVSGGARYPILLTANAVSMVRRDIAFQDLTKAARAALPAETSTIRSGAADDDRALYDRLVAHAVIRAWIADPNSVTDAERAAHIEDAA